jgi:predicted DCC family thiol-disulfide oxidoreductase YuxK
VDPAPKPLLAYDGRCSFCLLWIERWKRATGDSVDYAPSSEASASHPSIPPEVFHSSVVLIEPGGTHHYHTGALAAITALRSTRWGRRLLFLYKKLPGFGAAAEALYRLVAGHRDEAYLLTRVLWGRSVVPPGYGATGWLFLRALALVYGVAFASLFVQVPGLIGSNGISPAAMFLDAVHGGLGSSGPLYYPTLAWFDPGDPFLLGLCVAGMAASALLFAGLVPRIAAFICWISYFSLVVAGQAFFQFQWDSLLLEAGFLAIFFAPGGLVRLSPAGLEPPRAARWLLWLLLFRLMFMSGVAKLAAGDMNWWNLSALTWHYQTQPLPTPLAWYAHQLPAWFHRLSAFLMFCVEIGAPFLLLTPRRLRHLGAWLAIGLQVLILLTGNFAFFNLLTIALCLTLFDDGVTARLVPGFLRRGIPTGRPGGPPSGASRAGAVHTGAGRTAAAIAFALMAMLNFNQVAGLFVPRSWWPRPVATATAWAAHFRIVNGYGLFRVMTVKRPEIVIEGSDDRLEWKPYGFRFKPGDTTAALRWAAPYQPRLDWQLWFAALGNANDNGWLTNLAIRILEGSPEVLALLGEDPFGGRPPRYVRVVLYEYRFTTPEARARTGAVWERTFNSLYIAPMSLEGN